MEKNIHNVKEIEFQPSKYNKKSKEVYNIYNIQDCAADCTKDCLTN